MSTFPVAAAQRILLGSTNAVLRVTLLDQDGNPADAAGPVTVDLVIQVDEPGRVWCLIRKSSSGETVLPHRPVNACNVLKVLLSCMSWLSPVSFVPGLHTIPHTFPS